MSSSLDGTTSLHLGIGGQSILQSLPGVPMARRIPATACLLKVAQVGPMAGRRAVHSALTSASALQLSSDSDHPHLDAQGRGLPNSRDQPFLRIGRGCYLGGEDAGSVGFPGQHACLRQEMPGIGPLARLSTVERPVADVPAASTCSRKFHASRMRRFTVEAGQNLPSLFCQSRIQNCMAAVVAATTPFPSHDKLLLQPPRRHLAGEVGPTDPD